MKKIIILLIIGGAILQQAQCQNVRYGVFATPGISWFKSDVSRISSSSERLGFNFGLMMDHYFAPQYAFSTGLSIQYMGGGVRYNFKNNTNKILSTSDGDFVLNPGTQVTYKLQYIHVPLAMKFRTVEIGYITYFAQLGLDPMINLKANATFDNNDTNGLIENTGVGDEVSPLYMAYHVSAGFEYRIVGNTALMVGLSFMNGFSNVLHDNGGAKTILNVFELRMGVFF